MATITAAQVTLPFKTGLPRDVSVNVFHFLSAGDPDADGYAEMGDRINAFYTTLPPGDEVDKLCNYMSPIIKNGADDCSIKFYDAQAAKPRPTLATYTFDMPAASGAPAATPNEAAACLSWMATGPTTVVARRRRGRTYLGPLNHNAYGSRSEAGVDYPSLSTGFRNSAAAACKRLVTSSTDYQLAIFSRVGNEAYYVTKGYIDNELDIQRRRGLETTLRTEWTSL